MLRMNKYIDVHIPGAEQAFNMVVERPLSRAGTGVVLRLC